MEKPLIDKKYLLEKFPGKGGWTYAELPEIAMGMVSFGMIQGFLSKQSHFYICQI